MSVTYGKPIRVDFNAFTIAFSSDVTAPVPFRVYINRGLIRSFDSSNGKGSVLLSVGDSASPFVEVLDKACSVPQLAFSGHITLHWLAVTGAVSYNVQELVSAVWTDRNTINSSGEPAFTWESRWLEDITTHQFRIIAKDAAGNVGTAASYSSLLVRHPDTPVVTYTYNGSGTPTVTVAAA